MNTCFDLPLPEIAHPTASPTALRLFVAIFPPSALRIRLAEVCDGLRTSRADVAWVASENIHLTMRFLGNVAPAMVPAIERALAQTSARYGRFELKIEGMGVFPDRGDPRVVWAGARAEHGALQRLQRDIETALEALGFPIERNAFSPHLTLGRVRSSAGVGRLMHMLDARRTETFGEMTVDVVSLVESTLSPRGATYRPVYEAALPAAER